MSEETTLPYYKESSAAAPLIILLFEKKARQKKNHWEPNPGQKVTESAWRPLRHSLSSSPENMTF